MNGPGALLANGGEPGVGDQIVITRFQDIGGAAPTGHYRGLRFGANVVSASTVLQNVVIEFGGRVNADTNRGAVEVLSGSAPEIAGTIIRESLNFGLYAQDGAGSDANDWFHDNQLTANGRSPISIYSNDVSTLGADLELSGNGQDRVYVRGSTVDRPSASWANYGVPFYLNNGLSVRGGSVMSIAPGTELRFRSGQQFRISTNAEAGTLVASGTPQSPIRMTADNGTWLGLRLDDRVRSGTVMRNVRIEGFDSGVSGGLRLDNPANPGDRVAIVERCLFQSAEPGAVGVYLSDNAGLSSFESNVMNVDGISVSAPMSAFQDVIGPSNTYEASLRVRAGLLDGKNVVWSKPTASDGSTRLIVPTGNLTVANGSLTIRSGNQIEMPLNGDLTVSDAQLLVDGSLSEPVVFMPAPDVAYWNRIRLRGAGGGGASRISHAVLRSAGSNPTLGRSTARGGDCRASKRGHSGNADRRRYDHRGQQRLRHDVCRFHALPRHVRRQLDRGSRFSGLRMYANFVGRFGAGNLLSGNNTSGTSGHEGVWVVGDTVDTSATWPANDVPYVVQGDIELRQASPLNPVPVWTIEPGSGFPLRERQTNSRGGGQRRNSRRARHQCGADHVHQHRHGDACVLAGHPLQPGVRRLDPRLGARFLWWTQREHGQRQFSDGLRGDHRRRDIHALGGLCGGDLFRLCSDVHWPFDRSGLHAQWGRHRILEPGTLCSTVCATSLPAPAPSRRLFEKGRS